MFTTALGFTGSAVALVNEWVAAHANDAYLQAVYSMHVVSTLSLHQYFS